MTEKQDLNLAINFDDYSGELFNLSLNYPPIATAVLFFLANDMDENNISKATQKDMMDYFKKSRQTISGALMNLEELGFIEKSKYSTFNVYHINKNIFRKVKGPKK